MKRTKALKASVPDKKAAGGAEEKIKDAARRVFMTKGFAGARTRDIADAAGINLALLNYYFKNKQRLFDLIMLETLQQFMRGVHEVLAQTDTDLRTKTETIATTYVDMLLKNPDLPVFIMSEIRLNPGRLVQRMGANGFITRSHFFKQLKDAAGTQAVDPLHYFMNVLAMTVFPFIGRPLLMNVANISKSRFEKLMNERKKLIAKWLLAMLAAK